MRLVRSRTNLGGALQHGLRLRLVLAELRDAGFGEEALGGVDGGDLLRRRYGLFFIAAHQSGSQQVEFEQVAQRLGIARIDRERGIDLLAETPGQQRLLEDSRMLRHHSLALGKLAVIPRDPWIQPDRLLGQTGGRRVIAERVADL